MERLNDKKTFREAISSLRIKLIDAYIIKKFLGTFVFIFLLLMMISMVFDLSEKLSTFIDRGAKWSEIFTIYYSNFIIYFGSFP